MNDAIGIFLLFITSLLTPLSAATEPYDLTLSIPDRETPGVTEEGSVIVKTNRTTGVAPLSVSFDLTDSLFDNDDTLMLGEFMWDFGDDGDKYNIGKGYCPSHVYREPGIYTATVTAYHNDTVKTKSVTITVDEFTGTTYYISTAGVDSVLRDGSESEPFATLSFALEKHLAPNVRFLLRQGDTFTQTSGVIIGAHDGVTVEGPVIINSYEDSNNPSDEKPIIYDSRVNEGFTGVFGMLNCRDFRIVNIKFQAAGGGLGERNDNDLYPSGIAMSQNSPSKDCLFLDCDVQGTGPQAIHTEGEGIVIQDCTIRDGGSYGVYMSEGIGCAFIGLSAQEFANISPEYTMRLSSHIVKNYIAYCDLRADYTNNDLQIRGDDSSYNYIYKNQFDRFAGVNQTNNEEDETLHHNTFDSNIIVSRDYVGNIPGNDGNGKGFFFSSNNSMCRNNIVYGFHVGFYINTHDIVGGCKKLWYHNNTVIAVDTNSYFIAINKDAQNVELKNNIFYNLSETSSYSDRFINVVTEYTELDTDLTQIDSDYNIFIGKGWASESLQTLVGVAYYQADPKLADWRSAFSNGLSSIFGDALLNTTMDTDNVTRSLENGFGKVGSESPAIDAGNPNTIYTRFDFFGNERSSGTIGAISEFRGASVEVKSVLDL